MSKVKTLMRLYTKGVSKASISERLGLPRNTVKKYIRLFLACGRSLEELHQLNDGALEQMFLEMVPRSELDDDPKYKALTPASARHPRARAYFRFNTQH